MVNPDVYQFLVLHETLYSEGCVSVLVIRFTPERIEICFQFETV
jgi:hypothetical protein